MSLIQRLIDVTFRLAPGAPPFGGANGGPNQVTLSGLRCSARISNAGTPAGSQLGLQVWGMPLDLMNQLSTLGMSVQTVPRNTITVTAGDATNGMGTVYVGTIVNAWGDFQSSPEVPFHVQAQSGLGDLAAPVPATSFQGSADVVTVLSGLATQMDYDFENNGVSGVRVSNPYYPGTALEQARRCAKQVANVMGYDDTSPGANGGSVIAIWPRPGGTRGGAIPLITPGEGGMDSYPSFVAQGIIVRAQFNPSVRFMGKIQVAGSLLTPANGIWAVSFLDHELDSMLPGGQWRTTIGAYNPNYAPPVLR